MTGPLQTLVKGGVTMIPLALCSVLALAVVIQKSIALRRRRILVPDIVAWIEHMSGPEETDLGLELCRKVKGPLAALVEAVLENRHLDRTEAKELIEDVGRQQARLLERGLVILETVAGVAPLLGLFGTVIGMIKVFDIISRIGVGQASALSGGISEALITTAVGLSIGIPALVFYNYFASKAEDLVLDMEKYSTMLLRKVNSSRGQEPGEAHALS
ncbi:MAG: MotA/TolQ/ExbB proton channel family protein [candidate division KSB1 bacterium]|nr:MotA/TolQ/ExbB proton channel family protein [candidate division KSB1 bacterium]MDZ7384894.1 MotA/TolQ/ExbB proton channel family protein [candidate division KSB1 bacterium]MDZ7391445.1 MotA/TolQ/ExbB proton channel family protein [candidate division KSB1 bacterium]